MLFSQSVLTELFAKISGTCLDAKVWILQILKFRNVWMPIDLAEALRSCTVKPAESAVQTLSFDTTSACQCPILAGIDPQPPKAVRVFY